MFRGANAAGVLTAGSEDEVVVGVFCRELHAGVALPRRHELDVASRLRQQPAVVHLKILALEIRLSVPPELLHDGDVFGRIFVAPREMLITGPQAHLLVFALGPAGHDVDAEPAVRDRVDGDRHAGDERRRQREHGGRGVEPDLAGHCGEPGHQCEQFEVVVPELALAAEAAQLDHRQREFEPVALGFLHHLAVEIEAWLVLRGCGRDQPTVVADGDKDAKVHLRALLAWVRAQIPSKTDASLQNLGHLDSRGLVELAG